MDNYEDVMTEQQPQLFRVTGMDCASCAINIEKGVVRLDGVESCQINYATETMQVMGTVQPETVVERVRALGYDVVDEDEAAEMDSTSAESPSFFRYLWQRRDTRMALFGALLILPGLLFHEFMPWLEVEHWSIDAMSVLAMVLAGAPIARSAWRSVRINHAISIMISWPNAIIARRYRAKILYHNTNLTPNT